MKNSAKKMKMPGLPDKPLLIVTILLVFFGLLILASASAARSQVDFGHPYYFVWRQLVFGVGGGLLAGAVLYFLPHRVLKNAAIPLLLAAFAGMLAVFIPGIGITAGGAQRWLSVGPITFQPSEALKIAIVLYLAAWMSRRQAALQTVREGLLPFFAIMGTAGLFLMLQPDISTLGVLSLTALTMYFVAGARLQYIAANILLGGGLLLLLIRLAPYRANRILAFLNPGIDPLGIGWQVNQALLAVGSGGLWGRGLGFSREKFFWLPEAFGDAIFAVLAEELGFIGAATLILLFVFFAWRGFRIAASLEDPFLRFASFGLTAFIVIQALLNMGGITGLLPLTGITLPFVSYGSSSLVIILAACALLLSFSRAAKKPRLRNI